MKIIVIIIGVFLFLGALGAAGLLYVGYKAKQKITEVAKEQGFDLESSGKQPDRRATADGCSHLSAAKAAAILNMKITRTESQPPEGCVYFGDPEERAALGEAQAREAAKESDSQQAGTRNEQEAIRALEKMTQGVLGASAASGQIFSFNVQADGRNSWAAFQLSSKIMGGLGGEAGMRTQGVKLFESVEGLGDKAMFAPLGAGLFILKGDSFVEMNFAGAPVDRDKKVEIARAIISRL